MRQRWNSQCQTGEDNRCGEGGSTGLESLDGAHWLDTKHNRGRNLLGSSQIGLEDSAGLGYMCINLSQPATEWDRLPVDMETFPSWIPAEPPVTDRRQQARHHPSYLRCYFPVPGMIVDLSSRGMRIRVGLPMEVGKELRFRVRHRSRFIPLTGTVRWFRVEAPIQSAASRERATLLAGIEFLEDLAEESLDFMTGNGSSYDR